MINLIFLLFSFPLYLKDDICICRQSSTGYYSNDIYCNGIPDNFQDIEDIFGMYFNFISPYYFPPIFFACNYIFWCSKDDYAKDKFQRVREICDEHWLENIYNDIYNDSSLTISLDGRYAIPFCFGLKKLIIYKFGIEYFFQKDFEFYKEIEIPEGIEMAKFFEKYLIVITKEKILAYNTLAPNKFEKIGEYPFPHSLKKIKITNSESLKFIPINKNDIEMDGDFLYLLNPGGNELKSLLVFKLNENSIDFICDEGGPVFDNEGLNFKGNLSLNYLNEKKYLTYVEGNFGYNDGLKISIYRLEDNIPIFVNPFEPKTNLWVDYSVLFYHQFKNEYLYSGSTFNGTIDPPPPCDSAIFKFENEGFSFYNATIGHPCKKPSDNEFSCSNYRILSCGSDSMPTVEVTMKPPEDFPLSGNLFLMGKAYDNEGIKEVSIPNSTRAEIFHQEDGSIIWMAKVDLISGKFCSSNGCYIYVFAEDIDGDSNFGLEGNFEPYLKINVKNEEPINLPFGQVEEYYIKDLEYVYFKGWALDNSKILKGWLYSEDINLLVPINYGIERKDIQELYPEYEESRYSGFEAKYDIKNLKSGEYEFYIRIISCDFQVLDFGPFKININNHLRPF